MSKQNPFLIEQSELSENIEKYTILDASWYLPAQNRNGKEEYEKARIPGAIFFDIDVLSDTQCQLPHMLPSPETFSQMLGEMGVSEQDEIVVYDGPGLFSAARCWWTLRIMGAKTVHILQGGFDAWKEAGLSIDTNTPQKKVPKSFNAEFDSSKVFNLLKIKENLKVGQSLILDARPYDRFTGKAQEPRKGLRSGHIPGSHSLPASELITDGKLKPIDELITIFEKFKINDKRHVITSCGSGVTAAILSLGLESIGHTDHALYDGSWAEWGMQEDVPVASWQD